MRIDQHFSLLATYFCGTIDTPHIDDFQFSIALRIVGIFLDQLENGEKVW